MARNHPILDGTLDVKIWNFGADKRKKSLRNGTTAKVVCATFFDFART